MFACVTLGFVTPGVLSGSGYSDAGPVLCTGAASTACPCASGLAAATGGAAGFGRAQAASRISVAIVRCAPATTTSYFGKVGSPARVDRRPGPRT